MAKTISLKGITKEYSGKTLLAGVSLKLSERERICIVGENGAGKSTLLKILLGVVDPDDGSIIRAPGTRCYYVAQEFDEADAEETVETYLTKYAGHGHLKKVFTLGKTLGYDLEKSLDKICGALSGGQQKILALSVGIAVQPDFLLLDEPENHLDIVSRLKLIGLLEMYRGGIIFISHDRGVVDSLADKVAEIAGGLLHISEGGYQDYLDARLTRIAGLQRAYDSEASRIRQLQKTVVILKQKAIRGHDIPQYRKRQAELNSLKEKHTLGRPEDRRTKVSISQGADSFHDGRLICRIRDASFTYPDATSAIFKKVSLELRTGSHVVLLGRNGAGKSTFLKCLMGRLAFTDGTMVWMDGVKTAYFDQHAEFDPAKTALEVITETLAVKDEQGCKALGTMKFSRERMDIPIANLSGGERMRVRFALVFGSEPNFILLDEPTNHLDEVTWEILLNAVNSSKSTILLVTHDYEFIEGVGSKVFWLMHKHGIEERHKGLAELVEEIS